MFHFAHWLALRLNVVGSIDCLARFRTDSDEGFTGLFAVIQLSCGGS